jgi:3-oxoacyl-ACP reductase-like protein
MVLRYALLALAIAGLAGPASAQTPAPPTAAPASPAPAAPVTTDKERTEPTGDFNVSGDLAASAIIGAKIRSDSKEAVGTVEELFVDGQGTIKTVVVSVGGFLGVGARSVGVKWSDLKQSRDGNTLVLTTSLGKDELKALPPYNVQLRKPVAKDQAAAPR